jgi:hypothetical protein
VVAELRETVLSQMLDVLVVGFLWAAVKILV